MKTKKLGTAKILMKLVPMCIKAAPFLFWSCVVISVAHGISWGVQTVTQQIFFDSATGIVSGGKTGPLLWGLFYLILSNIVCQTLNGVGNYLPNILGQKAEGVLSMGINKKISRLSPEIFEDTAKLDDINKAEEGKSTGFWYVFIFVTIITFYIPYFLFMGGYLFSLKPILALSIVLVFLPTAFTQIIRTKVFAKAEDKSAPLRREYDYYQNCIVGREYFKETRLLGGFSYFKKLYMDTLDSLQKIKMKATVKSNLAELGMRMLTVGGYFGILLMLFYSMMNGEISIGAFAAVFNSIGLLYGIMEEVICRHIGSMAENTGKIYNYINFLELPERTGKAEEIEEPCDINLDNVSYRYPGADRNAVESINLTIGKGETLAVVGENGSGKTTLIRLITGLYKPTAGSVLYGKTDISEMAAETLYKRISAVFQKYQKYQMLLRENISISDIKSADGDSGLDDICVMAGCEKNGESFPEGYDTMLSREFDGVDLSGGQWQRVAIARGLFRSNEMIILDEPTAAIDPYEETRIYNRFAELSKGKTAVIVTHRIGSVKLADRIAVMKDGKLAAVGTHDELISDENGEYKRLYDAQEQWYRDEPAADSAV